MCTWTLSTVVEHFNMKGKTLYGTGMDCSKAFDMCSWLVLFQDLVERNVSVVFLRVLLFTYRYQSCDVRWNGKYSFRFPVSNGVKQGSVASPLLWACYCEKLFLQIRRMKIGATIAGVFYGILIYADDIFLLCPSSAFFLSY